MSCYHDHIVILCQIIIMTLISIMIKITLIIIIIMIHDHDVSDYHDHTNQYQSRDEDVSDHDVSSYHDQAYHNHDHDHHWHTARRDWEGCKSGGKGTLSCFDVFILCV